MTPPAATLTVALDDVGDTSWWARILTILGSQYGSTRQRSVGQVDGKIRYRSSTFPVAGSVGPISPQEQRAPGMTAALEELQRDLGRDGWRETARGRDPWSLTYERVTSGLS
ncbi:hypothetical protein [Arthrobacter methylotrophus]|uniref:hypothetical protein n=1 Tax=Arthrobacter methylotrophus TaxID=121291 RepID=UPI0031E8446B